MLIYVIQNLKKTAILHVIQRFKTYFCIYGLVVWQFIIIEYK